ncbi:hypothetical protein CEXT_678131 [Caerostris extrusa]|uniref:Uncharacterized protein n=1 Tax=Caerostris extrusa TaxID=172846 RepID=A0AAV4TGJ4_CAEEX|nr:hypothetical protein CEXT_678131 [Caerostris extrusa]
MPVFRTIGQTVLRLRLNLPANRLFVHRCFTSTNGKQGHLASWRGCPVFKATRKPLIGTASLPKRANSNPVDEFVTFADTL